MSQMIFSHDTELTLRAACVLINSDRVDGEQLGGPGLRSTTTWTASAGPAGATTTPPSWSPCIGCGSGSARSGPSPATRSDAVGSGECAAERHPGVAVADPASGDARVASAPGVGARPALAADGRGDGDGAGRPDPHRGAAPAQDLRRAGLRRGAGRPVAQPVGEVLRHRQLRQPPTRRGLSGAPRTREATDLRACSSRGCGDSGHGRAGHWPPEGPTSPRLRCSRR